MSNRSQRISTLFCTYCSSRKRKARGTLPAIRRYLSPRIGYVYRESKRAGARFAILSGRFGLLGPYQKIPYYDHLLQPDEINTLLPRMTGFLKKKGYRSVRFYHEPVRNFPQLRPYIKAIKLACRMADVRLELVLLPPLSS